jgi:hypothetical protein
MLEFQCVLCMFYTDPASILQPDDGLFLKAETFCCD